MVSLVTTSEILLFDGAAELRRIVEESGSVAVSGRALIAWALRAESDLETLGRLALESVGQSEGARSYHHVAVLGYAIDAGSEDAVVGAAFEQSLDWMLGRSPRIAGDPAAFMSDSVAVFGIALGARALGQRSMRETEQWLLSFVPDARRFPGVEPWQSCLLGASLQLVGHHSESSVTNECPPDVGVALQLRSALPPYRSPEVEAKAAQGVLDLVARGADDLSPARSALRLAAYGWIRRSTPVIAPRRMTSDDVIALLERVPAGLRRWPWEGKARTRGGVARKWHVDNEYHVQSLLYFLLAPVFPDLKEEESLPSLGSKQPRADLYVPSMSLLIEVKFVRSGDRFQKVIEEVAADASLYLAELPDGAALVPFIWDDSRRSEQHALLKTGLTKIKGVEGVVVVSRPGVME